MSFEVLDSEPRYYVEGFVDEVLWRTRHVIAEMGLKFERLLRDMMRQVDAFQARNYLITFDDVHFIQTRWMTDGTVRIDFAVAKMNVEDFPLRHQVIDEFVDGIVMRHVPPTLRNEFSNFFRAMITQFAALKKHASMLLSAFEFGEVQWTGAQQLSIAVRYQGQPFVPSMVRW